MMTPVNILDTEKLLFLGVLAARLQIILNPPYMVMTNAGEALAKYIEEHYVDTKADLFSVFIDRCKQFTSNSMYFALITQQSWLSLATFYAMRKRIFKENLNISMAQIGSKGFDEISGEVVSSVSFVMQNSYLINYYGCYANLLEGNSEKEKEELFLSRTKIFFSTQDSFAKVPGNSVVYDASDTALSHFTTDEPLSKIVKAVPGMQTSDNDRFLRLWFEIHFSLIGFGLNHSEAASSEFKWFPYNKGIGYRKWYGNNDYIVNFYHDGEELKYWLVHNPNDPKTKHWSRNMRNYDLYFNDGATFTAIGSSFSARYNGCGYLFDTKGPMIFGKNIKVVTGFVNSIVFDYYNKMLCKQLTKNFDSVNLVPFVQLNNGQTQTVLEKTEYCISLSRKDWDSFETSWDFQQHPFLQINDSYAFDGGAFSVVNNAHYYDEGPEVSCPVEACFSLWQKECNERFHQLKHNEEELNRIFINIYGLQNELTPDVAEKDVTVRKADLGRDIRSLVSYAVGCMLGRYSLKKPGLQFAGGDWQRFVQQLEKEKQEDREKNKEFLSIIELPTDRYESLFPDKDGILPITDDEYFSDDIVTMFVEWIKKAFGEEMLEENLKYIASALYPNGSGSARDLIRQYFLNDFYKDHLKIYQKRPIYWMFDSGKKNGFKCLVYMHRWAKDTVARVRTDYVHEMQSRYRTAIEELTRRVDNDNGSERVRLQKQLAKIQGQDAELLKYEEKVHHLADQMISIDLDDGVKHNYAIFEDVLAPIK